MQLGYCVSLRSPGGCLPYLVVKSTLVLPNSILVFNAPLKIKLLKIELEKLDLWREKQHRQVLAITNMQINQTTDRCDAH